MREPVGLFGRCRHSVQCLGRYSRQEREGGRVALVDLPAGLFLAVVVGNASWKQLIASTNLGGHVKAIAIKTGIAPANNSPDLRSGISSNVALKKKPDEEM